ncbi:PREDICTED: kunitz-type protease inhibitor 1 [Cyprinodon variegatus]|uniref:Serine peptidase inhibitor, Kunitz type 1 a n=1 Tax=Cyprinodon variegatus TaxID=28743 RepID=A0A3Q2E4S7_CYPVA|nr:PREDICTED: kunitz-type protease inhibitor 1 [Cyprinodon variegatus]
MSFSPGYLRAVLLLFVILRSTTGQDNAETCQTKFEKGRDNFVLDTDESVKEGATFLVSPKVEREMDCVVSCCNNPKCNVALIKSGTQEGEVQSCFLFDCLYKKKYVCRFVRKNGFFNYILKSVYKNYVEHEPVTGVDSPPVADAGQDLVVQPKESVTLNGIESKDDNKITSYVWEMLTDYPFAKMEKTRHADQIIVSNLTSGKYKFQLTVTDNSGQSDSTTVTVLVLTPEESEHHCMVPKKSGPCRGSFPRFHFNAASGQCEQFIFGGCLPNKNNYISKKECNEACPSTGPSGRGLPVTQGKKCGSPCTPDQFVCDGCCLESGLLCDNDTQCDDGSDEKNCEDMQGKFRILLNIPVDEKKARCTHIPETGTGRESYTKWYYDPYSKSCLRFNYGGWGGNDNRFDTKDTCERVCSGVTENDVFIDSRSDARVGEEDRNVLIIAALLGVAILVLLAVLGYCFIKRRRTPKHTRVPNGTASSGMGNSDHLVYNSTTKPL